MNFPKTFLDNLRAHLNLEKHDLESDLEKSIDGFTRERFYTMVWPEKSQVTAKMIFNGDEYTERSSSSAFNKDDVE